MNSALFGVISIGIVVACIVPFVLIFSRVFGGMKRQAAETNRLLQVGTPASAQILGTAMGRMTVTTGVHRHLQLVLQLQVHPHDRPPYAAQLTTLVSELQIPQLQPGAMVQVRFDPANPMKLALEGTGAHPSNPAAPPTVQYGAGGAAATGFTPVQPMRMPMGAKIGMVVGIVGAVIGLVVAVGVSVSVM